MTDDTQKRIANLRDHVNQGRIISYEGIKFLLDELDRKDKEIEEMRKAGVREVNRVRHELNSDALAWATEVGELKSEIKTLKELVRIVNDTIEDGSYQYTNHFHKYLYDNNWFERAKAAIGSENAQKEIGSGE